MFGWIASRPPRWRLCRGAHVRIRVFSHEPWGVMVRVVGHETVGASVGAVMIDSQSGAPRALREGYPSIGAELDAVVSEVRAYHPPAWVGGHAARR